MPFTHIFVAHPFDEPAIGGQRDKNEKSGQTRINLAVMQLGEQKIRSVNRNQPQRGPAGIGMELVQGP
ncbi:hypothetical protein D3C73_1525180 [compost metagenome]